MATPKEALADFVSRRRASEGWSRELVARRAKEAGLEISPSYIQKIEEGGVEPEAISLGKLEALATGLRVGRRDLETAGKIHVGSSDVQPNARGIAPVEVATVRGPYIKVAFYGQVGCGAFIDPCLHPDGTRDVASYVLDGADPDDYGTVEACGDSMNAAKPPIFPGMTMLVLCTDYAEDGQVVLANIPYQGTTCKRYRIKPDGHWLYSESTTNYPPIKMDDEIRIVGVVKEAWMVSRF